MRGGEELSQQAPLGHTHDHGSPGICGVEHGPHVIHAVLHGACLDPLGEPHPPLIKEDQAGECGEAFAESVVGRVFEEDGEICDGPLDEDDVARTFARHEIGDVDVAIRGISDTGLHRWAAH